MAEADDRFCLENIRKWVQSLHSLYYSLTSICLTSLWVIQAVTNKYCSVSINFQSLESFYSCFVCNKTHSSQTLLQHNLEMIQGLLCMSD